GTRRLRQHFPAGFTGPIAVLVWNGAVEFTTAEGSRLIGARAGRLEERKEDLNIEDIRTIAKPLGMTAAAKEVLAGFERLSDPGLEKPLRHGALAHYVSAVGAFKGHLTRLDLV